MSELISPCCNEELILVASIDTRRLYKCIKCKNYTKPKQKMKASKIISVNQRNKQWGIYTFLMNNKIFIPNYPNEKINFESFLKFSYQLRTKKIKLSDILSLNLFDISNV